MSTLHFSPSNDIYQPVGKRRMCSMSAFGFQIKIQVRDAIEHSTK